MINIDNLSVIYPDGNKAIDSLSFNIEEGESVAVVGANGAGKSTLLLSLVGVILPSKGKIVVNNIEVTKKNLNELRSKVGIVFQNPDDQLFMTRVYDDIAFGPRNFGIPENDIDSWVIDTLKALGIEHLKERMPHKLSGGEKRSVSIASVLSMQPQLILFDEPSAFLDPKARRNLIFVLSSLKLTKIIATHDLDMAMELCSRVIVLKNGALFADGKPKDILTDEKLMTESGLELPLCVQKHPL